MSVIDLETVKKHVHVPNNGAAPVRRARRVSDSLKALPFLSPALVLLLIFFVTPMVMTIYYSFTNLAITGAAAQHTEFIGLSNFQEMLSDPRFGASVWRTVVFLFFSAIVGQCVLGFIVAYLMKEKASWVRRFVGIAFVAAWVTPEVVAAFNIATFLGENGTMNTLLGLFGGEPIAWAWEFPMASVILANIWRGTAFSMMVFQAALDDIPKEIEEAASLDGCSGLGIVRRITIPMVRGTIGTNMMLVTLQTLGVFTLIFTMTGGGPGNRTTTLPLFMYNQAFISGRLGYGAAISLVLLVIGAVMSFIYIRALKMKV